MTSHVLHRRYIFQTEKQIKEFDDKLDENDKNNLNEKVEKLKESHKVQNMEDIEKYTTELNEVWHKISTKLYENMNQQSQATNEASGGDGNQSEVEETDFEEVK